MVYQVLIDKIFFYVFKLDFIEINVIKQVGILDFNIVVVVIGNYLVESIIIILNFKELGIKFVVVKVFF